MSPTTGRRHVPRDTAAPPPTDHQLVTTWGLALEGMAAVARVLTDEMETAVGLPITWVEVLFRLRRTPSQELPMTQLAREVSFSSGGFTKLMDHLTVAGLVERQPSPRDRRVVYAVLTANGRAVADRALAVHADGLRRHVVAALGNERLDEFAATLRLLRDYLLGPRG